MGIPGSKQAVRSLETDDVAESLTWHRVPVPANPLSKRAFRRHICLEVRNVSDACRACGRLPASAATSMHRQHELLSKLQQACRDVTSQF